jgi:hypothetical protein
MTSSSDNGQQDLEQELTRLRPTTPALPESFRLTLRQRLRTAPVHLQHGETHMKRLNMFAAAAALVVILLVAGLVVQSISDSTNNTTFPVGQPGDEDEAQFTPTLPPADDDGDGLTNDQEEKLGTDPFNKDTDGDGLWDGSEVNEHNTDPLNQDTDRDGLSDGAEVNQYGTNPLNLDTDGDGLSDGDEVNEYGTNLLNPDTDGDGLSDGAEVSQHGTSPLNQDTDGNGLSDGAEVATSSEPTPTSTPFPVTAMPPKADTVWIESVTPETGSELFGPGAIPVTITVGYWVDTVDEAQLLVQVQRPNGDGSGYGLGETTATLPRGRGSITVTVVIDNPAEVGAEPRNVGLLVTLWNIGAEKALFTDFPVGYEWLLSPTGE